MPGDFDGRCAADDMLFLIADSDGKSLAADGNVYVASAVGEENQNSGVVTATGGFGGGPRECRASARQLSRR